MSRSTLLARIALPLRSTRLLLSRRSLDAWLADTVADRYSGLDEVAEHRRQALAGPSPGQAALLDASLPPHALVLDVGCAAGRVSFAVQTRGGRVIGVDITEALVREAVTLARERGVRIPFCVMDGQALAFEDESFDAVLLLGSVLSHVPVRRVRLAALRDARRVLKPGGVLLVETSSRISTRGHRAFFGVLGWLRRALQAVGRTPHWELGDRFIVQISPTGPGQPVYLHMYTPDELARDLREAGFEPRPVEGESYFLRCAAIRPESRAPVAARR